MPTVAIVSGIRVEFYFNEHPPPHFHASASGFRATIGIENLAVLKGKLPHAKLATIVAWARERTQLLLEAWEKSRRHEDPGRIV